MNPDRRLILRLGALGLFPFKALAECARTDPNALGPYYRKNAPFRHRIMAENELGRALRVAGKVTDAGGCRPLAGAIVDVWHANDEGRYYDVGSEARNLPGDFRLRGRVLADDAGEYEFQTIFPGAYGSRPKHIHYIVTHPEAEPLVTQLYFEGDPRLDSDFLARQSLVRPVDNPAGNELKVTFDIVLGVRSLKEAGASA